MASLKIYVAGPDGFTAAGRAHHHQVLIPLILEEGLVPLDPWSDQAGVDFERAERITDNAERVKALSVVNARIGLANRHMIEECDVVLANCEGTDVDDSTAAEIGFAAGLGKRVFAFREDLRRTGDNEAAPINLQVLHFIQASGGDLYPTPSEAIKALARNAEA